MYYIYSVRSQGWMSRGANYTSDLSDAATFSEAEVRMKCKAGKSQYSLSLIPVSVTLVNSL